METVQPFLRALKRVVLLATLVPLPAAGDITLHSEPRAVHLQIRGPIAVEGVTPLSLRPLPPGEYLLRATGLGLVTARGRLRSTIDSQMNVKRWATPLAFLMPPGFVHMARSDGWRGSLFMTAAGGGTLGAIVKNAHHDNAVTDLQLAQDAYDQAVTEEEIKAAGLDLETAAEREDDEATMQALWTGYTAAVWAGAAVEAWLLTSSPTLRNDADGRLVVGVRTARPLDAGLRSALVPGSGQRHMGHNRRGIIFGASFLSLTAIGLTAYDEYLQVRRKQSDVQRRYDAATTTAEIDALRPTLEQAASDTDEWKVTVWSLFGTAGAVYVWNVLDAMGLGSAGWTRTAVDVSFAPGLDGLAASLTWRLP